jgi:hypothetical protein
MYKLMIAALVMALSGVQATAETKTSESKKSEGETKVKLQDVSPKKNKVEGDLDEEITNARMRAESGSKSKVSMSINGGYTGGALQQPFGVERPALAAEPGNQEQTSLDFGIDARYRINKHDSVTLGTSFGLMTPFQGDVSGDDRQLNVFDPVLGYNRTFNMAGLQTSIAPTVSAGTSNEAKGVDRAANAVLSVTALKAFESGLTMGLATDVTYNFYDNGPGDNKGTADRRFYGGDTRTAWKLGIYPFAEYSFNDRYSARTVFGYFNWRHVYGDSSSSRLLQTFVYQSVGIAISVSRDIYLYPNIQFVPDNIRSDFTNVAMSATLNVF